MSTGAHAYTYIVYLVKQVKNKAAKLMWTILTKNYTNFLSSLPYVPRAQRLRTTKTPVVQTLFLRTRLGNLIGPNC